MPTSNLFLNANWLGLPATMSNLVQNIRDAGVGAGASNVIPGRPTLGQQVVIGVYGADYRLEVPIANSVEGGELGGSVGDFTPEQIGTYAHDVLYTHYLFWARNTWAGTPEQQWWTGILPYLRTRPPLRTRCPNIYGLCVTEDPPGPVPPENQPPIVSAGADTSSQPDGTGTLAGSVTDDGLPGPLVDVGWTQVAGPQSAIFADVGSPTSQVSFPSAGTYVLRLTASDGELSASDDVTVAATVTVAPTNQPPQVNAGADASIQLPTAAVSLTGSATDDLLAVAALSLEWAQVSGPSPAVIAVPDAASTVATFSSAGTYVLRLTAHDGELSASDEVAVTVNPARTAPDVSGGAGGGEGTPPVNPALPPSSGGGGSLGLLELLLLGVISLWNAANAALRRERLPTFARARRAPTS
jgi:hypothetical protein